METVPVKISDIRVPNRSELIEGKITSVENSPDSISSLLHDATDPITLHKGTPPYEVYSGRHRVYVADQKGIKIIPAVFN
jgi:hypothetical protein